MLISPGIAFLAVCNLPPIDGPPDTGPVDVSPTDVSMLIEEPVSRAVIPGGEGDRDGDGIPDAAEMSGIAGESLLDFPAYGADPDVPDIFIQADWVTCNPLLENCGPNMSLDFHQVSSDVIAEWAGFYAPDFAIHVDNGEDPTDPARATLHGAWGGAHRLPTDPPPCGASSLGPRYGYFHRGRHRGYNGGGSGHMYAFCFAADSGHGSVSAHELGHNLGLSHGGTLESYGVNCKPHYRSPMNYGYLYDTSVTQFSRGERDFPLNGERLDEGAGFGDYDELALASLQNSTWSYTVREDGAVDWNRNGVFEDDPVRASVTWASASCEQSFSHFSDLPSVLDPTLAWLPRTNGEMARLYTFSRDRETGIPNYRHASVFDDCDLNDALSKCTNWYPDSDQPAIPIPGAHSGSTAIAGLGWVDGDISHMVIVYSNAAGVLHRQAMYLDADGTEVWAEPVAIAGGSAVTDGTPALVVSPADGRALLLYPDENRLLAYSGELTSGAELTFSGPQEQRWEDGSPILPCFGVGLTRGYQPDISGESVYALIPAGPLCELEFARLDGDGGDGVWTRMTDLLWPTSDPPLASERPGLAYVPFTGRDPGDPEGPLISDVENGRFFLAYVRFPVSAALIYMTEGNDPRPEAESYRLQLKSGGYMRNVWATVDGGVTLYYDHRFDDNLRAIWNYRDRATYFNPFADGIFDADMFDVDDYAVMMENIACSLTASC